MCRYSCRRLGRMEGGAARLFMVTSVNSTTLCSYPQHKVSRGGGRAASHMRQQHKVSRGGGGLPHICVRSRVSPPNYLPLLLLLQTSCAAP